MKQFQNCWEIMACGREKGGENAGELGECSASKEDLGHSCWIVAGTLCGGVVQGTYAQKEKNCMLCKVYGYYHRTRGTYGDKIAEQFPEEESKYSEILLDNLRT